MLLHKFVLATIKSQKIDRCRNAAGAFLYTRLKEGVEQPPMTGRVLPAGGVKISLPDAWIGDDAVWDQFSDRCRALVWLARKHASATKRPPYVEKAIADTIGRMRPSLSGDYKLILRPVRVDGSIVESPVIDSNSAWDDIDVFWQCVFASLLAPDAIRQVGRCLRCNKVLETETGKPSNKRFCPACKSAAWRTDPETKEKHLAYQREYQRARRAEQRKVNKRK